MSGYGTRANAVRMHIWTAIAVYVPVAIVEKRLGLDVSLHKLFQGLSLTLSEKMPMSTAVFDMGSQFEDMGAGNQLQLLHL
jgi:formate hydrogenlyase subunit 4